MPFISLISPLHTSQEQNKNGPWPSFNDSIMVHVYCYCYCWRTPVDLDDLPRSPHMNSGASSSLHSHVGLSGPSDEISEDKIWLPSSSNSSTEISSVQPSPREAPFHQCLMSCAERSPLPRTLASDSLLNSLGFKKTSHLPAEETWQITTQGPASWGIGGFVGGAIGSLPTDSVATTLSSETANRSEVTVRSPLFNHRRNSKYLGWNLVRFMVLKMRIPCQYHTGDQAFWKVYEAPATIPTVDHLCNFRSFT